MANIEQRAENTYRLVVSAGYDSSGKQIKKYRTIKLPEGLTDRQREKELTRLSVLFEQAVRSGTYLDGARITLTEFAQRWLNDYAEKRLAPKTLILYKTRLVQRVLPALGHMRMSNIQPFHILSFLNNLAEPEVRLDVFYVPTVALKQRLEGATAYSLCKVAQIAIATAQRIRRGSPVSKQTAESVCNAFGMEFKKAFTAVESRCLSYRTIHEHFALLSSVMACAVKWDVIFANPCNRVDLGALNKRSMNKPCCFDVEQLQAMFAALDGEPLKYKALIWMAIDSGMRRGELCGLQWQDVDFSRGTVKISKQRQYLGAGGIIVRDPKTDSGNRIITLSPTAIAVLRQYRNTQREHLLALGMPWNKDAFIFCHEDGVPMHPDRPYKWFVDFLTRHNLPVITFHALRHSNASILIAQGADISTISGRLGHADKNVTLRVYAHLLESQEKEAADKMETFYERVKESKK